MWYALAAMWLLRCFIMAVVILAGIVGTGLVGPNRLAVERDYALTHAQFGLGLAAIQIVTAVALLLNTHRLRHLNPVAVVMAGTAVQVVGFASIGLGWTRSVGVLALSWGLIVLGGSVRVVTNNISMDLWRHHPRRGVILLHSYNAGGKALGAVIASAFLAVGWRSSFLAVGGMTLATLLVFLPAARAAARFYADRPAPSPRFRADAFRLPVYWLFVAGIAMIAGGEAGFTTLIAAYFREVRHLPEATAGLMLVVHLLGLVAGRFISAYLSRRVPNNAIIGVCLASGAFVVPAVLVDLPAVRWASLFVMGFMFSSTWPTFYAQATRHLGEHRDMLAYGANLGSVVGISMCVLVSSTIADFSLTAAVFFGPAVLGVFGAVYFSSRLSGAPRPA